MELRKNVVDCGSVMSVLCFVITWRSLVVIMGLHSAAGELSLASE